MAQKLFLVLGIVWGVAGITQYFGERGDPSATRGAMQALLMAAVNLAVAWYLFWRKEKRERADR
jgi:uncharacterized membrane-anchored protein